MIETILYILGTLLLIESILILIFPKSILKSLKEISKKRNLKKAGIAELTLGLLLIIIGILINLLF